MKKLLVVTFCLCSAGCWVVSGVITVSGYERQSVTIRCSHGNAGTNLKYFCGSECTRYEDILVKTENNHPNKTNGRFTLHDHGSGTFNVTITGLRMTDTGIYWCGVERTGADTYTEVHLTVIEAPTTTTTTTTTTTPQTTPSTTPQSTAPPPGTTVYNQKTNSTAPLSTSMTAAWYDQLVYISVGLGVAALVFGLIVAAIIKVRLKAGRSEEIQNPSMAPIGTGRREKRVDDYDMMLQQPAADTAVNLHKDPNRVTSTSCKNDCIYENFTTSPLDDDLIYANTIQ
ncbi:CMRF35-like molecule 5 isoform X2 [Brienomyrus brachyistius]|uniref:CMRF35-like molecule 5 isoform X2 n=1 Tax=Brienomyrus brachyistius TaxID=42636 RepID=UPI0020B1C308|nr:CMRF35-like molecule 5 isoform X2 [Brienomyrus brachyistius]